MLSFIAQVFALVASAQSSLSPCCQLLSSAGISLSDGMIPKVLINNQSEIMDLVRIPASICTCGAASEFDKDVRIEIRGSSSAREAIKKSFLFTIKGRDKESDIGPYFMGFRPGKTFNLYGPENDLTMGMRNSMSMWMARSIGRYASRTAWAEVYLMQDGIPAYWGLYIAMEKIERGANRVNISSLHPGSTDTSGGYIVRYEHGKAKSSSVTFSASLDLPLVSLHATGKIRPLPYLLVYPDLNEDTWEHAADTRSKALQYISQYMSMVELSFINIMQLQSNTSSVATMNGRGGDPNDALSLSLAASQGKWRSLVDEASFIDFFLLSEISKNPDGYRGSQYFSKNKGRPLSMGPVWDFNEAYGLCCGYPIDGYQREGKSNGTSGGSAISPEGWRFNICQEARRCKEDPVDGISRWYQLAFDQDTMYKTRLSQRWQELRRFGGQLSDKAVSDEMMKQVDLIAKSGAARRNYQRWAVPLGSFSLFEASVQEMMTWLIARLRWMDSQLSASGSQ
jgi:hypothetical protein